MGSPVALVTGGGSGIGLAVAEHLINQHGYKVAIIDIDSQRASEESSRLGSQNCLGITADVTDYDEQSRAFVQAFEWGGNRLDVFFANAGIGDQDSLYKDFAIDTQSNLPKPLNLRTIEVNLNAVIQGIHLARHFFTEKNNKKGGRIVATSSVVGLYPNYCLPLYAASKHGIVGLVRSLAPVYLKDNITINSLNPTLIDTNLMPKGVAGKDDQLTGQVMELALDDVVLKQQPEYSRENTKWMFEATDVWEAVAEPLMPRKPGENAAKVKTPAELSF